MEKILHEILSQLKEHTRRFDSIDNRFDHVEAKIDKVENRLGNVETKVEKVEVRLENVENRLGDVEDGLQKLQETGENNATEFRSHFKHIETKLDQQEEIFRAISNELKATKIDIEYLSGKSGVHEMQINQLQKISPSKKHPEITSGKCHIPNE